MDVTGCGGVTDDGIKGLCSDENMDNEMKRMGQCKLLHTLLMLDTNITKKGVNVAIDNLPELRTFEFSCCVQILAELRRENLERGDFKTYPFTQLGCMGFEDDSGNIVPYEIGSLRLAAQICPNVNVVQIFLKAEVTDIELQGLLELKSLRELSISGHFPREGDQITFDGGVLPLLKAFGCFLRRLSLTQLNICVNIRSIAAFCPNLEYLSLQDSSYSMVSLEEGSIYREANFKNLKEFDISCQRSPSFSSEMLSFVLSSPELKSVSLFHCDALIDEVLEKAALIHEFRNLDIFGFYDCDCVTKKGIDILLNESNPLRKLAVNRCEMITKQEFMEWVKKARQENLEIKFEFSLKPHPFPLPEV